MRRALLVAVCALALAAPAGAYAHGSSSYVVSVRGIEPPLAGVHASVDRGGFRIVLRNDGRAPVVAYGPDGKPYLRFTRSGVAANLGGWTTITPKRAFAWPVPGTGKPAVAPLAVRKAPGKAHHLKDWRVRLTAGGRSYAIVGSVDYRVSDGGLAELLFPLAPTPLLLLFAVGIVRRARG
jgi:hypothetical protein